MSALRSRCLGSPSASGGCIEDAACGFAEGVGAARKVLALSCSYASTAFLPACLETRQYSRFPSKSHTHPEIQTRKLGEIESRFQSWANLQKVDVWIFQGKPSRDIGVFSNLSLSLSLSLSAHKVCSELLWAFPDHFLDFDLLFGRGGSRPGAQRASSDL